MIIGYSQVAHLRGRIGGEVLLDVLRHLCVGRVVLALAHDLHSRFCVDYEDLL